MALKNPILSNPIAVDIPKLNEILDALSKANPTNVDGISTGAMRLYEVSSGKWQWQEYNGSSWAAVPFLQHNVDQLDGYHAAITPAANTVAVRNASGLLQDSITGNAATASSAATLSETLPVNKGGTGATTSEAARSNLGVPPTSHTSTATTYGVGNATQYGHLKLSDATDSSSGVSGGVAATPAAAKAAKDAADAAMTKASTLATSSTPGIVKPGTGLQIGEEGALNVVAEQTGCLPLTGGTMTGSIATTAIVALSKSDNNSYIQINGGTSWENGASINLSSKDSKENIGGSFLLYAKDASAESCLFGLPNGSLTWCDSQVFLPVGAVFAFAADTDPSGCLICNGAEVSRTTYVRLFKVIGTTYGSGDGSTTFNLPNLIDRFIQGSGTAGTTKFAGLPAINGHAKFRYPTIMGTAKGAFDGPTYDSARDAVCEVSSSGNVATLWFNASNCSSVYGSSTTVQPPAVTMRYYIKY